MVHFSVFFRYMEEAEHALWRSVGLNIWESGPPSQGFGETGSVSWPRISARFDFKAPLKFQDEFEVRTEMGNVSRSTIQWNHTLMRGDTIIGSGSVTVVCVKKLPGGGIKSTEIEPAIISRLRLALSA
ncbi:MAG: acyl-CoA thioesterase [Cyanobacteria bacterium]|nr:acyl-CoA thioesterase [Cyanobacteriota bacterium]